MSSIRRIRSRWIITALLMLSSLAAMIALAGTSEPVGAAAPAGERVSGVRFQQVTPPRRESGPVQPGPAPLTGSASVFRALIDPNWGANVRANIDTQSPNRAQQEPSIAINPLNPLNVVAAAKDERGGVNTKQIWIYTSTDGGVSWINQIFPHATPLPSFSSDPVVKFADDGVCYVVSLPYGSGSVGIQVATSTDNGITFSTGTRVTTNGGADKEWMWVDNFPSSPYYHRMYVGWMDFSPGFRLTYSTDRGQTWIQSPLGQSAYQFPMPIVYPNGDVAVLYAASFSSLANVRSTSGGTTWSAAQTIGPYDPANCPPDNSGCGVWRNPSVPVIAVNPLNGNAVVAWADGSDGTAKIRYVLGSNNGTVWGASAELAPPGVANTYQIQPWVEADDAGTFHAIWLDDRDNPNTSIFNVFYSNSTDDGQTWSTAERISTSSFDLRIGIPSNYGLAAGDYINVTADSGNVYAAWTDTRSGTGEDIYVVRGIKTGGTPTPTPTLGPTATPCVSGGLRVLAVHVDAFDGRPVPSSLRNNLLADSRVEAVDFFNGFSGTPTLSQLQAYDIVFTFSNDPYHDAVAFGNNLADYVDGGGIVVASYYSFNDLHPNLPIRGRWQSEGYSPYLYTTTFLVNDVPLGIYDAGHPMMQGVSTLVSGARMNVALAPGAKQVAAYSDGSAAVAVKGRSIGITSYLGDLENSGQGDYALVIANAGSWLSGGGCPTVTATVTQTATSTRTSTVTSTPTSTPTSISTSTRTSTPLPSSTSAQTATSVPPTATDTAIATNTPGEPTATPTACALMFTDVPTDHTFYDSIRCLACRGIINGYASGCESGNPCFRPGNLVTRGQLAKIVSNSAGFSEPAGDQQFEDVPVGSTFFEFVWRLADREIVSGYTCGGPGEPCIPPDSLPYFRPNANVTRGQLSKIVAEAAGLTQFPSGQQFEDVPSGHTFYEYIWRLTSLGIMSGYTCGGVGEPCVPPDNRPYFRPGSSATRGQASKIVANTFFPECGTLLPTCAGIPPSVNVEITPGNCEPAGTQFTFVGSEFDAHESVGAFITLPDGSVAGAPFQVIADENGVTQPVIFTTSTTFPLGTWTMTMEGITSHRRANGYFRLLSP